MPRHAITRPVAVLAISAIAVGSTVGPVVDASREAPASTGSYRLAANEILMPPVTPSLYDQIRASIVPSRDAAPPSRPEAAPSPTPTNANIAVKNFYNAVEPWVRYGFEVATYAVGWVPYVGWLAPQIMIFYNFGERIARSITFNVDDWLLGPLPFVDGLRNVARDSRNALVQLAIDQWTFWLPPLPPLPPLPQISAVADAAGDSTPADPVTPAAPDAGPAESGSADSGPRDRGAAGSASEPVPAPNEQRLAGPSPAAGSRQSIVESTEHVAAEVDSPPAFEQAAPKVVEEAAEAPPLRALGLRTPVEGGVRQVGAKGPHARADAGSSSHTAPSAGGKGTPAEGSAAP